MNRQENQSPFLKRAGGVACIVTLLTMLGGHWLLLQSFAWARMLISYSQHSSLGSAICRTFDGKHPCGLCLSIHQSQQDDRQKEHQKLPWTKPDKMPELFWDAHAIHLPLPPMTATQATAFEPHWHADFIDSPPTPPPKRV